jgi:hypothetical protein
MGNGDRAIGDARFGAQGLDFHHNFKLISCSQPCQTRS